MMPDGATVPIEAVATVVDTLSVKGKVEEKTPARMF